MSSSEQTNPANTEAAEYESDLAEFERQVQFSEFVPNPLLAFESATRDPLSFRVTAPLTRR